MRKIELSAHSKYWKIRNYEKITLVELINRWLVINGFRDHRCGMLMADRQGPGGQKASEQSMEEHCTVRLVLFNKSINLGLFSNPRGLLNFFF